MKCRPFCSKLNSFNLNIFPGIWGFPVSNLVAHVGHILCFDLQQNVTLNKLLQIHANVLSLISGSGIPGTCIWQFLESTDLLLYIYICTLIKFIDIYWGRTKIIFVMSHELHLVWNQQRSTVFSSCSFSFSLSLSLSLSPSLSPYLSHVYINITKAMYS